LLLHYEGSSNYLIRRSNYTVDVLHIGWLLGKMLVHWIAPCGRILFAVALLKALKNINSVDVLAFLLLTVLQEQALDACSQ
jgi:hypothetical protein